MGKKKKHKKEAKLLKIQRRNFERMLALQDAGKACKSKCCKKYKKCESKRCKKCPCQDLLKSPAFYQNPPMVA